VHFHRSQAKIVAVVALVAVAFYAGTRHQKHRETIKHTGIAFFAAVSNLLPLKFSQTVAAEKPAKSSQTLVVDKVALAYPAPDRKMHDAPAPSPSSPRQIDTTLLPLLIDTVALPRALGVAAGYGGGMAIVDDRVIVVDLQGGFFKVESRGATIEKLHLPELPNHAGQFARGSETRNDPRLPGARRLPRS
jgi:hypothetical protein